MTASPVSCICYRWAKQRAKHRSPGLLFSGIKGQTISKRNEKIIYNDSYEKCFIDAGYKSIDDFFATQTNLKRFENSKRHTEKIELPVNGRNEQFFIKRFFHSHLADNLHSLLNFGRLCSQAETEYRNANLLIANGFNAYQPVCFGEEKTFGLEQRSFFITKALTGKSLMTFALNNMPTLNLSKKEQLLSSLGKELRRIHNAGISMPDLYIWHIFVDKPPDENLFRFTFIDLHRMCHNVKSNRRFAKDLGRLLFSMDTRYFTIELCRLLIDSYADDSLNADTLWAEVLKNKRKLSKKRNLKSYREETI